MEHRKKRFFFRKKNRISSNSEIRTVLSAGKSSSLGFARLYAAENALGFPRFAVSVNKKVGKAAVRNRIKRLSREVFRTSMHQLNQNYDYLLIIPDNLSKNKAFADSRCSITFDRMKKRFLLAVEKLDVRNKEDMSD